MDVAAAIRGSIKGEADVIFMDPPYGRDYEKQVLQLLKGAELVGDDTLIVVEALLDADFSFAQEMGYVVEKEKCYKTNKHVFLHRA